MLQLPGLTLGLVPGDTAANEVEVVVSELVIGFAYHFGCIFVASGPLSTARRLALPSVSVHELADDAIIQLADELADEYDCLAAPHSLQNSTQLRPEPVEIGSFYDMSWVNQPESTIVF